MRHHYSQKMACGGYDEEHVSDLPTLQRIQQLSLKFDLPMPVPWLDLTAAPVEPLNEAVMMLPPAQAKFVQAALAEDVEPLVSLADVSVPAAAAAVATALAQAAAAAPAVPVTAQAAASAAASTVSVVASEEASAAAAPAEPAITAMSTEHADLPPGAAGNLALVYGEWCAVKCA